tara:strand:- start:1859 stop:2302 length:444 start_codon:yes stop_codon:yes gene_type:complete
MNKDLYTFDGAMKFRTKRQMKRKYNRLFNEGKYYLHTGYTDIEPYPGWYILIKEIKPEMVKEYIFNELEENIPTHDGVTELKRNEYRYLGVTMQQWSKRQFPYMYGFDKILCCDFCDCYQTKEEYKKYKMCVRCYKQHKNEVKNGEK